MEDKSNYKNIKDQGTFPKGSTRALFAGGETPTFVNTIDYITVETAGNATDYGDLTSASEDGSGAGTYTRAIFGGFRNPSISAIIEYCSPDTLGNTADFGDLTQARSYMSGSAGGNNTRSIFAGVQMAHNMIRLIM